MSTPSSESSKRPRRENRALVVATILVLVVTITGCGLMGDDQLSQCLTDVEPAPDSVFTAQPSEESDAIRYTANFWRWGPRSGMGTPPAYRVDIGFDCPGDQTCFPDSVEMVFSGVADRPFIGDVDSVRLALEDSLEYALTAKDYRTDSVPGKQYGVDGQLLSEELRLSLNRGQLTRLACAATGSMEAGDVRVHLSDAYLDRLRTLLRTMRGG